MEYGECRSENIELLKIMGMFIYLIDCCLASCNQYLGYTPVFNDDTNVLSSNPGHGGCQLLATGRWFSPDIQVFSINKTNLYNITENLLKVALSIITLTLNDDSKFTIIGKNKLYIGMSSCCPKRLKYTARHSKWADMYIECLVSGAWYTLCT